MHSGIHKHTDTFPAFPVRKFDNRAARDGVICRQPLRVAGASRTHIGVTGGESPYRSGQGPHVLSAAFSRLGAQFMGGRARGSRKARRCSIGLSTPVSVAHPCERGLAVSNRNWSIIMTTSHRGEIRQNQGAHPANIPSEILNSALIEVDSIGVLLECHQKGWHLLTAADLALLVGNLRSLADKLEKGHE